MRGRRIPTRTTHPPLDPEPAVTLANADVMRGRTAALRDVTFELPPGSLTAVVGPNGAGKSSLFALISGRLRQARGEVRVRGAVAEVLQRTQLDPDLPLTVDDVVRLGRFPSRGPVRPMRRHDRHVVDESLDALELRELRRRPISQLSGGQQQRALVAQGLAQQAPVLLLDEPNAGLDAQSQRLVLDVMRSQADAGNTVMFATHDLTEAARADHVIVLACECVCCAPPITALADPTVTALFGPAPRAGDEQLEEAQLIASRRSTNA